MSTHTPGPWMAVGSEVFQQEHGGGSICTVTRAWEGRPDPSNEATAQLIAAAPALATALAELLAQVEGLVSDGGDVDARFTIKTRKQARAALDKAGVR